MLFNIKPIILYASNYAFAELVNNTFRILLFATKKKKKKREKKKRKMRMNNYYKS